MNLFKLKCWSCKPLTGLIILVLATACSGIPPESIPLEDRLTEKGYKIGESVKRLNDHRINGWSSVDRRNVILNVGVSEYYLVTVRRNCEGLNSATNLAFSTTVGNLTDKDKLVVRGPGRFLEDCYIDTIRTLEKTKPDKQ